MPSKGKEAASTPGAGVELKEKVPAQPVAILPHATLPLIPPHPPGFTIQRSLFYNSTAWHTPLHNDVSALLDAFNSTHPTATTSPFATFKQLWISLGWAHVHLLGILEGPMKKPWAESLVRAFLEHIHKDEAPLIQVAAIFAVYTLWATQPPTQEKFHIAVDPPTLDYLRTTPLHLSPFLISSSPSVTLPTASTSTSLDPSLPSATTTTIPRSPALDLTQVLHSLFSNHALFLVPFQVYLHPPLPAAEIRDKLEPKRERTAGLILGAEREARWIREGRMEKVGGVGRRRGRWGGDRTDDRERIQPTKHGDSSDDSGSGSGSDDDDGEEGDFNDDDEEERQEDIMLDGTLGLATSSIPRRRRRPGSQQPSTLGWGADLRPASTSYLLSRQDLIGASHLRAQIVRDAEEQTVAALRTAETHAAAEGVVPGLVGTAMEGVSLLGLVGQGGYTTEGKKGLQMFESEMESIAKVPGRSSSKGNS